MRILRHGGSAAMRSGRAAIVWLVHAACERRAWARMKNRPRTHALRCVSWLMLFE
jgi:hypothetical protein